MLLRSASVNPVLQKVSQTERFHVFVLFLLYGSEIIPASYSYQTLPTHAIYTETLLVVQDRLITAQVKAKREITHANFFCRHFPETLYQHEKKMSNFFFFPPNRQRYISLHKRESVHAADVRRFAD